MQIHLIKVDVSTYIIDLKRNEISLLLGFVGILISADCIFLCDTISVSAILFTLAVEKVLHFRSNRKQFDLNIYLCY